jgi:hypothetical protein
MQGEDEKMSRLKLYLEKRKQRKKEIIDKLQMLDEIMYGDY